MAVAGVTVARVKDKGRENATSGHVADLVGVSDCLGIRPLEDRQASLVVGDHDRFDVTNAEVDELGVTTNAPTFEFGDLIAGPSGQVALDNEDLLHIATMTPVTTSAHRGNPVVFAFGALCEMRVSAARQARTMAQVRRRAASSARPRTPSLR